MIRCAVIDDEPLARIGLVKYIEQVDFLDLVGQGGNPVELNNLLGTTKVDLIFLDIQMPIVTGIDFLKMNPNLPPVIFTTAYPSYALEGYDLNILDYLLKPITMDRFLKAANKAKELIRIKQGTYNDNGIRGDKDHFFLKCDYKYEKIFFDDILFVQAMQNYVTIHTKTNKYTSLLTLKSVELNLSSNQFIRVHKSFIVAIDKVDTVESHELLVKGHKIPVSRNYRQDIKHKILENRLWKNDSSV